MPLLARYWLILAGGVALYLLTFILGVHKPLTVGITKQFIDYKIAYLSSIASERKIAIFAGSNGRMSHRCETIEQLTRIKCVNLSIAAGQSMVWQLRKYAPFLKPADLLYLPLEYFTEETSLKVGNEAPYLVAYERHELLGLYGVERLPYALFYFDIKYFFSAIGEMILGASGKQRRFSLATLTRQGDETGHTEEKGQQYRSVIANLRPPIISAESYRAGQGTGELKQVLAWANAAHVQVVGGLPTTFDDASVPEEVIADLRLLYRSYGDCFVLTPSRSLYPRAAFYDTAYHLNETFQKQHSALLAPMLAEIIRSGHCALY